MLCGCFRVRLEGESLSGRRGRGRGPSRGGKEDQGQTKESRDSDPPGGLRPGAHRKRGSADHLRNRPGALPPLTLPNLSRRIIFSSPLLILRRQIIIWDAQI